MATVTKKTNSLVVKIDGLPPVIVSKPEEMKQYRHPDVDRLRRVQLYKAKYQDRHYNTIAECNKQMHQNTCNLELFSKDEKLIHQFKAKNSAINFLTEYNQDLENRRERLYRILKDENTLYDREITRFNQGRRDEEERLKKREKEEVLSQYQKEHEIENDYKYDGIIVDMNDVDFRRYKQLKENERLVKKLQLVQIKEKEIEKQKDLKYEHMWHEMLMNNYEKQTKRFYNAKLAKREALTETRRIEEKKLRTDKQRKEQEMLQNKELERQQGEIIRKKIAQQDENKKEIKQMEMDKLARDLNAQFLEKISEEKRKMKENEQKNIVFDALHFERGFRPLQYNKGEVRRQLDLHNANLKRIREEQKRLEDDAIIIRQEEAEGIKRLVDQQRMNFEANRRTFLEDIYQQQKYQINEHNVIAQQRRSSQKREDENFLKWLREKNEMAKDRHEKNNQRKVEYARELREQMFAKEEMKKLETDLDLKEFQSFVNYENHYQRTAGLPKIWKTHIQTSHPFQKLLQKQESRKLEEANDLKLPKCSSIY